MASLGKAFFELVPKMKEADLKSTLKAIKTDGMSLDLGKQLGKGLVKGFAALGVGKAIADTITASVKAYADYEQLVGGVETLFKDSADVVQGYAANAYKTAGMSANQYMETVTSFSASLLQSLDGDTSAAAEYADMAITDMADNANKMGTSMEAIQNAYQGFAKQNYTMLDNLKLGYGGTKTEMERLLADAEKLSGVKYDISNLSDVYEAIHVIQLEMGMSGYKVDELKSKLSSMTLTQSELNRVAEDWARDSKRNMTLEEARAAVMAKYEKGLLDVKDAQALLGTTAREAELTLSGSFNQMKAAWENFLVVLGDPNGDVEGAMQQLVGSMETVLKNAIPVLGRVIAELIAQLPNAVVELVPVLVEAVVNLLLTVWSNIESSITEFFTSIGPAINEWCDSILEGVSGFFDSIVSGLTGLWDSAVAAVSGMWNDVVNWFSSGVDSAVNWVMTLPDRILSFFSNAGSWLISAGSDLVNGFISGIESAVDGVISAVTGFVDNAIDAAKRLLGIASPSKVFAQIGAYTMEGFEQGIEKNAQTAANTVRKVMDGITTAANVTVEGNRGSAGGTYIFNITADSETTLQSLVKQAQRARIAYGRA